MRCAKFLAASGLLLPLAAFAHGGDQSGFLAAFTHPFTGLDHLLAMLIVGVWTARRSIASAPDLGLRTRELKDTFRTIALPLSFVTGAAGGLVVGHAGFALAYAEPALIGSLILFGLAVAAAINGPTWLAAGVCAAFGFAHGVSHGAELTGSLGTIVLGMALAATLLLAAGYWLARTAGDRHARWIRICGALIGVTGLMLLRLA